VSSAPKLIATTSHTMHSPGSTGVTVISVQKRSVGPVFLEKYAVSSRGQRKV
jgi:hypothetical protein